MSARGRVERAIEALQGGLAARPDGLRRYALDVVIELVGGTAGLWYELGMVRGNPYPVRHVVRGPNGTSALELPLARQLEEEIPWPTIDPRLPPKGWNRAFVLLPSIVAEEHLRTSRLYDRVWRPAKMQDQLRMVVYHRGEHVAWIGAVRRVGEPKFSRADRRRLAPIADALADALVTAHAVEGAAEAESACDLFVMPSGKVAFASDAGQKWLARRGTRDRLAAWIRQLDRGERVPAIVAGHRIRWSRLRGAGGLGYLVQLDRPQPVKVHPGFRLSRTQCEVARLAAAGATATEIARMGEVSAETVRGQLKQVYELLGIASRAELGRVFADVEPHVELPTVDLLWKKRSA